MEGHSCRYPGFLAWIRFAREIAGHVTRDTLHAQRLVEALHHVDQVASAGRSFSFLGVPSGHDGENAPETVRSKRDRHLHAQRPSRQAHAAAGGIERPDRRRRRRGPMDAVYLPSGRRAISARMHSETTPQNLVYLSMDITNGFGSPGLRALSRARRPGVSSNHA